MRWQVERSFSWINRFAKARVRMEKSEENYVAILQIAAAWITLRTVLG
jgi:transposase